MFYKFSQLDVTTSWGVWNLDIDRQNYFFANNNMTCKLPQEIATVKQNWMDIISWDLKNIDTRREEAKKLVTHRAEWCQPVT